MYVVHSGCSYYLPPIFLTPLSLKVSLLYPYLSVLFCNPPSLSKTNYLTMPWHWCHNLVDSSTQRLPLPQNLSETESSPRWDTLTWNLSWSIIDYCQAELCAGGDNLSYYRVTARTVFSLDNNISQPSFLCLALHFLSIPTAEMLQKPQRESCFSLSTQSPLILMT